MTKLHYKYLINKTTVRIILLILMLLFIYYLFSCSITTGKDYKWLYQKEIYNNYYQSTIIIVKIILPIFGIFIYGYSFLKHQDDYCLIIIKKRITRVKYCFTKLITLSLIMLVTILISYYLYYFVGLILIPNFIYYDSSFIIFLNIYLRS